MLLLRIFRRIICIIFIIKAAVGQKDKQQQHELMTDVSYLRSFLRTLYPNTRNSLMHNGHESEKATRHRFEQLQTENGNSLAAREIAMEILSEMFPSSSNTKAFDDVLKRQQLQSPYRWHAIKSGERANFRDLTSPLLSSTYVQQKQHEQQQQQIQKDMGQLNAELFNWHENTKSGKSNSDLKPAADHHNRNHNPLSVHELNALTSVSEMLLHYNDYDMVSDDSVGNLKQTLGENFMKSISAANEASTESMSNAVAGGLYHAPILTRKNVHGMGEQKIKRNPLSFDEHKFMLPHYPFAFYKDLAADATNANDLSQLKWVSRKRYSERTPPLRTSFLPSISAGAMTNLGKFFGDLSKNVHFNEQQELHESKVKLLEGDHPLRMLQKEVEDETDEDTRINKTAQFLQAIRSYRPSQKIRSLVSMNPQGYHGSNFLDPNYMWVGLGK